MKNLFKRFIKNKYFILWVIFFILILYIIFNPLLHDSIEYMKLKKIEDYKFIFNIFVLPMSFYEINFVMCLLLELAFFSIISYIQVSYINLFFKEISSITLIRINRNNWIKELININLYYSIVLVFFYILFFYILCIKNNIIINISLDMIVLIIYKMILGCFIPLIFLYIYIDTKNEFNSIFISLILDLFLQLVFKISYSLFLINFIYFLVLIVLIIIFGYLLRLNIINKFERCDL